MIAAELQEIVRRTIPYAPIYAVDKDYARPSVRWVLEPFAAAHKRYQRWRGLVLWCPQWDCDDFAAEYRCHACRCHAKTRKRSEQGIAVGEVWYMRKSGGGHAINIAVTDNNEILFLEPQTCESIFLNTEELESCWFVRF